MQRLPEGFPDLRAGAGVLLVAVCALVLAAPTKAQAQGVSAAPVTSGDAPVAPAAPDAALLARGQRVFLRCASCHDITGSGVAKMGPPLKGVIGRKVASAPGYEYSKSLATQSFTWDPAHLQTWLERPTAIAAGTTMAFEGLPRAIDREAVIAYLATHP
jgi:cytochrome c